MLTGALKRRILFCFLGTRVFRIPANQDHKIITARPAFLQKIL